MPPELLAEILRQRTLAERFARVALLLIPINAAAWFTGVWCIDFDLLWTGCLIVFSLGALAQLVLGVLAVTFALQARKAGVPDTGAPARRGALAAIVAPLAWFGGMAIFVAGAMGGAWGRPLRIRGRQLHPNLREGSDWTRGLEPDPSGLDAATRAALEALWLHDAQKEHASVPAFSRISWMLAAVGAPAELLEGAHEAALEEIEHTRLCFALAAGYGGRSRSVEAMPELLLGFETGEDPLVTLAVESLGDGCQLEDFNADVAAACAAVCREPVTRGVLEQIAVEERSHAEFSWDLVAWLLVRDRARVAPALERALAKLHRYRRPTAVAHDKLGLVAKADAEALLAHGRLPDARWAELWDRRLEQTTARLQAMLEDESPKRAA